MLPDRQVPTYSPALGAWLRKLSVALGDPAICARVPGCLPLDLFGGQGRPITQAMLNYILATQLDSYVAFLQEYAAPEARKTEGLQAAFKSIFPIESHSKNARLEFVTVGHHRVACDWLRRLGDQALTYTDATSFAVMAARRCRFVLGFDHHFEIAGFELWRPGT